MKDEIYEKIAGYCDRNQLFASGDGVVVGLSGGADSVFLLLALVKLQKRWNLRLCAVHINHGIRGDEALQDQQFSVAFAERLCVDCKVEQADIPAMASQWKMTEEEAGRTYRYQCFEKWRRKLGYQKIAVAHHRDDQAETILFQLLRGSSLRGLGGMRPERDGIVRPLLNTGRQEIEAFLKKEQIGYCVDSTNAEDIYVRNRIRHQVLPFLQEKIQPAAVEHIAQTGEHLREIMEYIDEQVEMLYRKLVDKHGEQLILNAQEFGSLSVVLQRELILYMVKVLAGRRKDITSAHVEQLLSVFLGETGRMTMLPYELRAKKSYDTLVLYQEKEPESENVPEYAEEIVFGKTYGIELENGVIRLVRFEKVLRENLSDDMLKNHCTKCFDYAKMVSMPIFRYPQKGDFLWLDPNGRTKKLSRLFIDEKLDKKQRERVIVLAEGNHILWVPVLNRCSAYYYVSEDTQKVVLAKFCE